MKWKKETEMPTLKSSNYHFGNTNLNMTLKKVQIKKYFVIQLFTLHRIHISDIIFGFIDTLKGRTLHWKTQ